MKRRQFVSNSILAAAAIQAKPLKALIAPNEEIEKLVILHTNDTHSRIEPFDSGEFQGLGGISSRKTLIDSVRKEEKHVLLLDAGDIFQGTPYFNLYQGALEMKAMSMLGYDAGTLGNHDFDLGIGNFVKQHQYANFPFIVSNYDASNTEMKGIIHPYHIMKKGRIKIGILGLGINLDGYVPSAHFQGLIIKNPVEEAKRIVNILKFEKKCDLVIALSHLGFEYKNKTTYSDVMIAELVDNIDIIIGGHTHTFLKCPKIVQKPSNKYTMINQVGFAGINLGRIDLYFHSEKNKVIEAQSNLIKCEN